MSRTRTTLRKASRTAAAVALACLCGAVPVTAQAPTTKMLDTIAPGAWLLDYRDGKPARRLCVRSGQQFVQLRNSGSSCTPDFVESSASQVTVQYSCPSVGYTRTTVRRESAQLLQIRGGGMRNSRPFNFTIEARRAGDC